MRVALAVNPLKESPGHYFGALPSFDVTAGAAGTRYSRSIWQLFEAEMGRERDAACARGNQLMLQESGGIIHLRRLVTASIGRFELILMKLNFNFYTQFSMEKSNQVLKWLVKHS